MTAKPRGKKVDQTCACGAVFKARVADVKRGWGLSCSKACAAKKRERELDRKGNQPRGEQNLEDSTTFQNAHLFDNTEL